MNKIFSLTLLSLFPITGCLDFPAYTLVTSESLSQPDRSFHDMLDRRTFMRYAAIIESKDMANKYTLAKPIEIIELAFPNTPSELRNKYINKTGVTIKFEITPEGMTKGYEIMHPTNPLLSAAVIESLKHWRFKRLIFKDKPVPICIALTVYFRSQLS